jgi:hypothetical protein
MNDLNEVLETLSQVLIRCAGLGLIILFVWFGAYLGARDFLFRQGEWFGLSPHEVSLVAYAGMGLVKLLILVFFLFPYVAIRWVLRNRRR